MTDDPVLLAKDVLRDDDGRGDRTAVTLARAVIAQHAELEIVRLMHEQARLQPTIPIEHHPRVVVLRAALREALDLAELYGPREPHGDDRNRVFCNRIAELRKLIG